MNNVKEDYYQHARNTERAIKRMDHLPMSEKNRELIKQFKRQLVMEHLSPARIETYMIRMPRIAVALQKDFDQATKDDLMGYVEVLDSNTTYSPWTKCAYKVALKKFYKWLKHTPHGQYPEEVASIRATPRKNEIPVLRKEDLLTDDEIRVAVDKCRYIRDKALLMCLYESGCRIGELATLRLKDVTFDEYGAILTVNGKTGHRQVRITFAASFLGQWFQEHPRKEEHEAPLWAKLGKRYRGEIISYQQIQTIIRDAFDAAGISKRAYPHLFRHSMATQLANTLNQFHMNNHFGWVQGSTMPGVYIHLNGKDTDKQVLAARGIQLKEKDVEKPRQISCYRCEKINFYEDKFCRSCGSVLKREEAILFDKKHDEVRHLRTELDAKMALLLKDDLVRRLIEEKLKQITV